MRLHPVVPPLITTTTMQVLGACAHLAVPALAPAIAVAVGLDPRLVGLYAGVIFLGAAMASLVAGSFITCLGPIRVSQICLLGQAIGLAVITIGHPVALGLGGILVGLGYGPLTPASSHLLKRRCPPRILALVFSLKQTGVPLGYALAGWALPLLTLAGGWRFALLATAATSLLVAAAVQPYRATQDDDRSGSVRLDLAQVLGPLKVVALHPSLRRMAISSFCFSGIQVGTTAFLTTYLTERLGLDLVSAGQALATATVVAIAGRIGWGAVADALRSPRLVLGLIGVGMAGAIAALVLLAPGTPLGWVLAVSVALGLTSLSWNGVFLAETARAAPPALVGAATGGVLTVTFSGSVLFPPLLSAAFQAAGDYAIGFGLLGALGLVVGLDFLVKRTAPAPTGRDPGAA